MRKKQCLLLVPIALLMTACGTKEKPKYDITYYDGTDLISTIQVEEGLLVEDNRDAPNKQDYTFAGWYIDSGFTTPYDFTLPVTENISLYAYRNITVFFIFFVKTASFISFTNKSLNYTISFNIFSNPCI